jgi:hypothetical protein
MKNWSQLLATAAVVALAGGAAMANDNLAYVVQAGSANESMIDQAGIGQLARVDQHGDRNVSGILQSGWSHAAVVDQPGTDNKSEISHPQSKIRLLSTSRGQTTMQASSKARLAISLVSCSGVTATLPS